MLQPIIVLIAIVSREPGAGNARRRVHLLLFSEEFNTRTKSAPDFSKPEEFASGGAPPVPCQPSGCRFSMNSVGSD
jgi:hypothetical protein